MEESTSISGHGRPPAGVSPTTTQVTIIANDEALAHEGFPGDYQEDTIAPDSGILLVEATPGGHHEDTVALDGGAPTLEVPLDTMQEERTPLEYYVPPPETTLGETQKDTIAIGSGIPPLELLVEASKSVAPSLLTTLTARRDSIPQHLDITSPYESPDEQHPSYHPDFLMPPERGFEHKWNPDKLMYNNMNSIYRGRSKWICYPPAANAAYLLDSEGHDPKLRQKWYQPTSSTGKHYDWQPSRDEQKHDGQSKYIHKDRVVEMLQEILDEQQTTKGEILAKEIKFNRPAWVMATPGVSGAVYAAGEQREDFIRNINKDKDGTDGMEHCSKCGESHIPPGSPITLGDRDTCFSRLPEWFPREVTDEKKNPWDMYRHLLNCVVLLDEIEEGHNHYKDPAGPEWDLHFHEKGDQWITPHARDWGGWWKCRGGENAPEAERNCRHCHQWQSPGEKRPQQNKKGPSFATRKKFLQEHMERLFKEQGQRDKEAALEMLRRDGIPQYFGPPLDSATKAELIQKQALLRPRSIPDIFQTLASVASSAHVEDVEAEADRDALVAGEFSLPPPARPITSFFL